MKLNFKNDPNYFDQKKREKEEITQANCEEKPKETIEGRKLEQGIDERRRQQNRGEMGGEDSRTQQRRKREEKTRKIWRKERHVSAKMDFKTHCFSFFVFFL